jgi:hypothetical protein
MTTIGKTERSAVVRVRSEKEIAGDLAYRATHKAEATARAKAWAKANPEKRLAIERRLRARNKDKISAQKRAWRKANPEKHNAANARWKINRAMKLCDFAALLQEQAGRCAICLSTETGRMAAGRLSIDHCHETNVIRGLLCHRCNSMLGLAKDSIGTLRNAIAYLEKCRDRGAVCGRAGRLLESA